MSIYLPNVAVTEFDTMMKQEFQAAGFLLRDTMQIRKDVVGDKVRWQRMGTGIARQKAAQDNITPMNVNYTPIEAIMKDYYAADYSDIFKQQEVNFDEKRALAKSIGMAIGRRMDQIAIDAVAASGTTNTIADGGTGFTFDKLLKVIELLDQNGVPANVGRRFIAISAQQQTDLLKEPKLTSHDYIVSKAIVSGGFSNIEVMGFKIIVIPDMTEGGLPKASNVRSAFAWHEYAMGYGIGIDFKTLIDWIPEKTSYLVNGIFKATAAAVDPKGVVKIDTVES